MKPALTIAMLLASPAYAQNMSQMGRIADPAPPAERQARIDACFRDAPQTSAREAWLDRCLRDAR